MIVDTSSIMAILFDEPDWMVYEGAIFAAKRRLISAATLLDAMIVSESRAGPKGAEKFDASVKRANIVAAKVTKRQVTIAREAWRQFGKGNHPARLNYGDCFSYALAKDTGLPLLYKGDDFAKTDIRSALQAD